MLVEEKNSLTEEIESLVNKYGADRSSLLPVLQDIQRNHKHVSDFAQQEVARILDIHPVEVFGVMTFYSFLHSEPLGRNIVRLCKTVICSLNGKANVAKAIERELGISFGETTKDKRITLEYANCLGLCDQGPVMIVNDRAFTHLTPEKAVAILSEIK